MKFRRVSVACLAAAVVAGTVSLVAYARAGTADSRVAKMFGGEAGLRTVTAPDNVEAYRLAPLPTVKQGRRTPLDEFETITGPVAVPADDAKKVGRSLAAPNSYRWDEAKGCIPIYGVRLSFLRGEDRVDVLLCFECNILLVYRNGTITGGEDFDSIRPLLVRVAKAAFPGDEVIGKLKERE